MTERSSDGSAAWSPSQALRLDEVCLRFEEAWKAASGKRPRLESYLGQSPESLRGALLHELLAVELAYRCREGERPTLDEYGPRFPEHLAVLRSAFAEVTPLAFLVPSTVDTGRALTPATVDAGPPGRTGPDVPAPESPGAASPWANAWVPGGRPIPGYEVVGLLGRGGMGVVYRAVHLPLKRVVALKMIRAGAHAGAERRARFQREAEAAARLQHPNIVQIYEVGEHDGLPYLALEFVEGGSLDRKLGGAPQPPGEAARLVETLARAMEAAHAQGVVHRDLKPANVLLTRDGVPKVTDFGLAKRLDVDRGQTQQGEILGTPSYMAPEQGLGKPDGIDPRADVYALGAVLYEMLTGRPPFRAETQFDTVLMVLTEEPVPPRRLQPKVPTDLETICLKCLQKGPRKRYASALELADDLGRFLRGEPIRARPVSAGERALKWARRHPGRAALAATAFLAVLGGACGAVFYGLYQKQRAANREQQALVLQQQLDQGRRFDGHWARGQEAERAGDFTTAKGHYDSALAILDAYPDLAAEGLRRTIKEHSDQAGRRLEENVARQKLRKRLEEFEEQRDEVLVHEISATPSSRDTDREAIRRAAPAALARFGIAADDEPASVARRLEGDRPFFSPGQLEKTAAGCYQVLLTWAEAEPVPGPAADPAALRRALHLLDLAEALGQAHHLPTPRAYHVRRARYLALLGEEAAARGERDRAEGIKPETALDLFLTALDAYRQNQVEDAAVGCEAALRQEPDHFWAQYLLALCRLQTGHWGEAKAWLAACLSRHDFFLGRLLKATAETRLDEPDAAEADFALALGQAPDDLARSLVLTSRGALRVQRQRWDEAVADLRQATELRPDAPEAYVNLAAAYRGRQDWDGAVAALDRALALRPDDAGLYHTRAQLHAHRGDRAAARRDFEQAVAHEPAGSTSERLASAWVELGHLRHLDGDYEPALTAVDAALRARPDYAPAHRQRAETLLALDRHREAGAALDRYLQCHGTPTPEVHLARGLIHAALREYAEAVDSYGRALALRPDARTLTNRGWAYLKLDAPRPALADFQAALRLDRASSDGLCGRAHAEVRLGQVQAAVADAEAALAHGPKKPRLLVSAACVHALAVGWLEAQPAGSASTGSVYRYQERAVELLREALDGVPSAQRKDFWSSTIQNEPDLAPLRRSTGLLELARSYAR
jgi:tetratricopeptide (TPR) repeat protein